MGVKEVNMPINLLLDFKVTKSGRLTWAFLQIAPPDPKRIAEMSGLSLPTVRKQIKVLIDEGWYALPVPGRRIVLKKLQCPRVPIPVSLLANKELSIQARLMYGYLQLLPEYRGHKGKFRYKTVTNHIPLCTKTIRRHLAKLREHDWLKLDKKESHLSPIPFTLTSPGETMVRRVNALLKDHPYTGEALTNAWCQVLINSDAFTVNGANGMLRNYKTGKLMQYDLFYYAPRMVSFEFNGPQHYHRTKLYDAATVCEQKQRDQIKADISEKKGVELVIITREDLSLKGMQKKIGNLLPLRNLDDYQDAIRLLEIRSKLYREKNNPECNTA